MHAILFDIDGTMISSGGAGSASLMQAVSEQFNVEEPQDVPVHGCTDRGIAANLFQLHGIENTEENWQRFREAYLAALKRNLTARQGYVLPGISRLLEQLSTREDVAIGLLTGNTQEGAEIKLRYFELHGYFRFGGFGDSHEHRDDVAREARAAVHEHSEGRIQDDRVWVLGDTPADIRCARAIGAQAVAVATGVHPQQELVDGQPDLLLKDFSDPSSFLERLDA